MSASVAPAAPAVATCPACREGLGCEECLGHGTREGWRLGRLRKASASLLDARNMLGQAGLLNEVRAVDAVRETLQPGLASARPAVSGKDIDAADAAASRRSYQHHGRRWR